VNLCECMLDRRRLYQVSTHGRNRVIPPTNAHGVRGAATKISGGTSVPVCALAGSSQSDGTGESITFRSAEQHKQRRLCHHFRLFTRKDFLLKTKEWMDRGTDPQLKGRPASPCI
jgi:hypothetical protein